MILGIYCLCLLIPGVPVWTVNSVVTLDVSELPHDSS